MGCSITNLWNYVEELRTELAAKEYDLEEQNRHIDCLLDLETLRFDEKFTA